MARIKVKWDLTKPLPNLRINERVVVRAAERNQLTEIGKILGTTWGGFIKDPETTVRWIRPRMEAKLEQPFIAYLEGRPVGTVGLLLDRESASGRVDDGVHARGKSNYGGDSSQD